MKSVITAAVLLIVSIFGCLYLSSAVSARIDELYKMTEALPQNQSTYKEHQAVYLSAAEDIGTYWSETVPFFSYVCGYAAMNRADEAVWMLYAAMQAEDHASAMIARYQLLDALRRMRELERISLASIF